MVPANQGSRGGLLAWTVFSTVLFVTATVFAIYFYVEANKVSTEAKTTAEKFRKVVTEAQLADPAVSELEAIRSNAELGFNDSMSLLDVATKQRDDLVKELGGPKYEQTMATVASLKTESPKKVATEGGAKLDTSSIKGLIGSLTDALVASQAEVATVREQLTSAQKAQENAAKELATAREAMDKQLAEVRGSAQQALDSTTAYTQAKDADVQQLQSSFDKQLADASTALQESQNKVADLTRASEETKQQMQQIQSRLQALRLNVADPIVRQADGQVVRIPAVNVVYIDLGQGDQVSPGMTFQVFDKVEGVPPIGDTDSAESALPLGKASLEIVRVGPTSSEARVIRTQPGQTLTEGDLIVNLIYDRNTRYNFMVFGNFDLDRNSVPTAADAEVIKRLVTQWGGRLTDKVNVDTDFVVLGAEPEIPVFTRDELSDPINQAKYDQARAEAEAYDTVRRSAQEYNVPILNQNRFLYFVGFYELSKR